VRQFFKNDVEIILKEWVVKTTAIIGFPNKMLERIQILSTRQDWVNNYK